MNAVHGLATEPLCKDHDQLARVLVAFDRLLDDAVRHGALDDELAESFARFFEEFGDGFHHSREEDVLFPAVRRVQLAFVDEDVHALLGEHEVGRKGLAGMRENLAGASAGAGGSLATYLRYARNLSEGWRRHMDHEEQVIFPLADRLLLGEPRAELAAALQEVEERWRESLVRAREFVRETGERFGVTDLDVRRIGRSRPS